MLQFEGWKLTKGNFVVKSLACGIIWVNSADLGRRFSIYLNLIWFHVEASWRDYVR